MCTDQQGPLHYDHAARRWRINGTELHCGDTFEIHQHGTWETVRIEYDHSRKEYYTIPHIPLEEHLEARQSRY